MKKILFGLFVFFLGFVQVYAADKAVLKVNTEGNGEIKVVGGDEELVFGNTYPKFSIIENTKDGKQFKLGAKASEQWEFVNWTLDGRFYSTEPIITIEMNGDMEFVAVFVLHDQDEATTDTNNTKTSKKIKDSMFSYLGIGIIVLLVAMIGIVLSRRLL